MCSFMALRETSEKLVSHLFRQTVVVRDDKIHQEDVLFGYPVAAKIVSCLEQNFIKSTLNECFICLIIPSL